MTADGSSECLSLQLFGIPTLIIADDPRLIMAARTAYAQWSLETPVPKPHIELRLETGSASSDGVCLDISVEGSRLQLSGPGASGAADAATGRAKAIMSAELARDPAAFADVTDTLLLFLLARSGRTPVHASAFILGDLAVVLAGPSGSGKSTLALAAAGRGLPILSDDMVFVQREPSFVVWGLARPIHVYPTDSPPGEHPVRARNDKTKMAIGPATAALKAERAVLVLLEHGAGLHLRPIERGEAIKALMNLDPGFDLLTAESRTAIDALAESGTWRLTLTDDPGAAIDLAMRQFATP